MSTLFSIDIDGEPGLKGYVSIHSTIQGRSYGGFRIASDLSSQSIVKAARTMTLKHGFLGLPLGGSKAGIVADPEMPLSEKNELLKSFGQSIKSLLQKREYVPSTDMGVTIDDIKYLLNSSGLRMSSRHILPQASGFYAGLTVFTATVKAANHIGLDLNNASVAIEGFGSVGSSVALACWQRGIKVVAVSTSQGAIYCKKGLDIGELIQLYNEVGSQVTRLYQKGELMDDCKLSELDVDIFSPCAQPYSITLDNVHKVTAKIISPGANIPLEDGASQILIQKGTLAIPDFVANCGGALATTMKRTGLKDSFILHFIEHKFGQKVTDILRIAEEKGVPIEAYAELIAEEHFLRVKEAAENRTIRNKVFGFPLYLYRQGVIPYQLGAPLARIYFDRIFA